MFPRDLPPPRTSFFLFGARGTGKSTWIRARFDDAFIVNLLGADAMLRYQRDPSRLREEVLTQPRNRWIVIDEVQRVPAILDEVHFLMEEEGYKRFALIGSSARKLKRGGANLLAGRAVVKNLFPLTASEMSFSVPASQLVRFGAMPLSVNAPDDDAREEFLRAYVTTYLSEEIRAEGLVRDLGDSVAFSRLHRWPRGRSRTCRASRAMQASRARRRVATSRFSSTR